MPPMPVALRLYLVFAALAEPLWRIALSLRARRGREDRARLPEKLGVPSAVRPAGRLVWFHAVSVGESMALLTLLRRLGAARPDLSFLLTTSTRASGQALAAQPLPDRVIHQYAPADCPRPIRRFLDHWRPDAFVLAEADTWPATLLAVHRRGIPMLMLNVVVTRRRQRRARFRASFAVLFGLFRQILAQDADSAAALPALGAPAGRIRVMGVLKAASDPLPDNPAARAALSVALGTRPRWLAASTKVLEEPQLMQAHALALAACPDLLFVIAPRQPSEADATEAAALAAGLRVARRSRGEVPSAATQVYLADTIGEMGLWYRLCPVAFIGNSMPVPGTPLTGKNPWEALALGCLVIHGPSLGNFAESYRQLREAGAAVGIADAVGLAEAVLAAQDPGARAPRIAAAARLLAEAQAPLAIALDAVQALADGTNWRLAGYGGDA
jgi:3-deoxy-D-manno-octulosonic-acid transferase